MAVTVSLQALACIPVKWDKAMLNEFSVAQNAPVVEEEFQSKIIDSMSQYLLNSALPVLLHAPTGFGKTLMMGRVLERLCQQERYLWLWFVPFVKKF